jgi:hypothetical protein
MNFPQQPAANRNEISIFNEQIEVDAQAAIQIFSPLRGRRRQTKRVIEILWLCLSRCFSHISIVYEKRK